MPEIARLGGIVIVIYYSDHNPPHFHARYQGGAARVQIDPVRVMDGNLPRQQLSRVLTWANRYKRELADNWNLAQQHKPTQRIGDS
jgi:hypothetical protein